MFWIFVRMASVMRFSKYPKHMFYMEIRTKENLFYILIYSLSILYNSKFVLIAILEKKLCRFNEGSPYFSVYSTLHIYLFC